MNNAQNNNHLHINHFSTKHLVHKMEKIKDMHGAARDKILSFHKL